MYDLNLLTYNDYSKLTNDDLKNIRKLLPELKDVSGDQREWLKNNIEIIKNIDVIKIIKSKVFAGQVTVKLYKLNLKTSNDEIIKKLRSNRFKFNKIQRESADKEQISIYSTLMLNNNTYLLRLQYNNGLRKVYGQKIQDIRDIDVLYHVNEKVLEVRTDIKKSAKIKVFLERKLSIMPISGIRILRNYRTIEKFSDSINGHFKKMSSNTALGISELDNDDIIALGELVFSLDEFLLTNNIETFIEKIENLKFSNKLTFTQAFLAGCSQIGLSVSDDLGSDLKNQGLYKTLSKYLSNEDGYITFKNNDNSNEVTIRLSTKLDTNTIQFVSSATESEIKMIVDKVIGDLGEQCIEYSEIEQLSKEIEEYLSNSKIKNIRPEYLVENFNLPQDAVLGILKSYMVKGNISESFELLDNQSLEIIKEFNSIDEMRMDTNLIIDKIDPDYKVIGNNEAFIEEYSDFINVKYIINKHKVKEDREINRKIISEEIELELNNNSENNSEKKVKKDRILNIGKFLKAGMFLVYKN